MVRMVNIFFGTWAARLYLLAVLAAAGGTAASGPSYAIILLIALTSPVSIIFAPIFLLGDGWMTTPMLVLSVLAGYLLNLVLINWIVAAPRPIAARSRARDAGPHAGVPHHRGPGGSGPRHAPAGGAQPSARWQRQARVPAGVR
ncbi:SCO4225 family membrane protein [Jidongwangia harbinensis]|uniref:SCO4225 family membrane protein n=1 Tax=Jidongwangia harbinensis TaxID=2878561 RepID=UPI001CDA2ABC|nr:hypothetical protein [Jidongwangia harbinensis]